MTELTDEHFRQNIRQNPDDKLGRGIYGDWLEEQGDTRSALVRLFEQARVGLVSDNIDALQEMCSLFDGNWQRFLWGVYDQLTEQEQVRVQVECVFRSDKDAIQASPASQEMLRTFWDNHRNWELLDDLYESLRWRLSWGAFSLYSTYFDHERNDNDIFSLLRRRALNPQLATAHQNLIVLSYYLFGTNVLPGSFERTGLTP